MYEEGIQQKDKEGLRPMARIATVGGLIWGVTSQLLWDDAFLEYYIPISTGFYYAILTVVGRSKNELEHRDRVYTSLIHGAFDAIGAVGGSGLVSLITKF